MNFYTCKKRQQNTGNVRFQAHAPSTKTARNYVLKSYIEENGHYRTMLSVGLGDIPVLRYYCDKYIHDNIIASILAYCDNCANNTPTTIDTVSTKPQSVMQCSRCNFKNLKFTV